MHQESWFAKAARQLGAKLLPGCLPCPLEGAMLDGCHRIPPVHLPIQVQHPAFLQALQQQEERQACEQRTCLNRMSGMPLVKEKAAMAPYTTTSPPSRVACSTSKAHAVTACYCCVVAVVRCAANALRAGIS